MNLWKAFWKCNGGNHDMRYHLDTASMRCHNCGLAATRELLEEIAHGYRQGNQNTGSQAGAIPGHVPLTWSNPYANTAIGGTAGAPCPSLEPVAQEIIAERGWNLSQDKKGPVLMSVTREVKWDGPTLRADAVPALGSDAGIYAQDRLENSYRRLSVWGQVALSGVVVEGTNGWRAEQATIRSLRVTALPARSPVYSRSLGILWGMHAVGGDLLTWKSRAWEVAEQLAQRYQCECELDWLPTSNLPAEELVA